MSKLFEPIQVRGLEIRNRVWMAPMCEYSCENRDGVPGSWHEVHYLTRAVGGTGLIIVEASAVSPIGRITPWDTGIWNDQQVEAWARINQEIHRYGAKSAIQIAHAGRKANIYREWSGSGSIPLEDDGWVTVSPTSEAFTGYAAPRRLETSEIPALIEEFVSAAERAVRAGFDAVEIHAAHGYLIHQFLSPLSNDRTDEYGGTLENRARFLVEVTRGIRIRLGDSVPLFIRFSATDYSPDGWDEEQTTKVARWCHEAGADLFDISSGGLITGVQIPSGPGYQVPLAEYVAERVGEPVSAVGQITDSKQAEAILNNGQIAVIMLGRVLLRDPYWAAKAAIELGVDVDYLPVQYRRGSWKTAGL